MTEELKKAGSDRFESYRKVRQNFGGVNPVERIHKPKKAYKREKFKFNGVVEDDGFDFTEETGMN